MSQAMIALLDEEPVFWRAHYAGFCGGPAVVPGLVQCGPGGNYAD